MDFKIGDDIEEGNKKQNTTLPIIIVIVMSIIIGLIVFFISNAIFGVKEKKEDPPTSISLGLTDENVQILYKYVTYGTNGERNEKFIKEKNVTIDSFSNQEKFYYAFQFVKAEDLETLGRLDENNRKVYTLSSEKVKEYMKRFFGGSVTYNTDVMLTYPFNFKINGQNVGYITESSEADGFDIVFYGLDEEKAKEEESSTKEGEESSINEVEEVPLIELVKPYYAELVGAYKEPDGTYRLEENIVYTEVKEDDGVFTVYIFKDYEKTQILETKPNQTKEMLMNNPISIDNYKDRASKITYHFGLNNNVLYFESSKITYE